MRLIPAFYGQVCGIKLGRIDTWIHIDTPKLEDRALILTTCLEAIDLEHHVNVQHLATLSDGKSCSDIKEWVRRAALLAFDQGCITTEHFLST